MSVTHWLNGIRSQFSGSVLNRRRKRRHNGTQAAAISGEALENRRLLTTTYINAGGPDLAGDPSFVEDDAFQNGVGLSFRRNRAIDLSQVDSSLPGTVFESVLWDARRGPELSFDIPTTPGADYEVDLLFSEIWGGAFRSGVRVFDVSIEGDVVLDDFDIYHEVGARTALSKSFSITAADGNLDIDFAHVRNNPAIAGIIVRRMDDDGPGETNSPPSISSVANQTIDENQTTGALSFTVNDADGDVVVVTATSSNTALVPATAVAVVGRGMNRTVTVTPTPDAFGVTTVTLTASDGQDSVTEQFLVTVNDVEDPVDPPTDPEVIMLNTGGSAVGDFVAAAPFHNLTRKTNPNRNRPVSNVPDEIPQIVFQSNIWNPRHRGPLLIDIPNESGAEYQVDLLFAEMWGGAFRSGVRQFDVYIDGQQVLNDFDIFAEVGARTAVVKSFTVTGDGNLDIDLSHVRNNPLISGVIVTPLADGPGNSNRPPVISSLSDQSVTTGSTVQFTATASDPDGDTFTWSIVTQGLPGSPSINPQTGAFNWTPPTAGVFNTTLQVSDGNLTNSRSFTVTVVDSQPVNRPPVLTAIPAQQTTVGTPLTFTAIASDPDPGDSIQYFLNPDAPAGAFIDGASGVVSWTPTAAQQGVITFPVFATDGQDDDFVTVTVTVSAAPNRAPVLSQIGDKSVILGDTLSFTATATDPGGPGDDLQFSLGPNAPAGAGISASTGLFSWTPTASSPATSTFNVNVTDGDATDFETITVTVLTNLAPTIGPIPDQTVQEGTLVQVTVQATDPNNDSLTYSLVSTGLPGNAQINASIGVFMWTAPPADGPGFEVIVQATDTGGLSDTASFNVIVTAAPNNNTPPVLAPIPNQSGVVGQLLTFTATATDVDVLPDSLRFFLDPSAPVGANLDINSGSFTWTPSSAGTFTFPVIVNDGTDDDVQDVVFTIAPAAPNQAPAFGPVGDQTATLNEELQVTLPASDPENDSLTFSLITTNLPGIAQVNAVTGVFSWTPNQIGPGFDVTVRVTDTGGLFDDVTFTVTVNDAGPGGNSRPVLAPIPNQDAVPGTTLTFTALATDADGDPLEYFLDPTAPNGAAINMSTGVFTWTPTASDSGPVAFPVLVSDGFSTVSQNVSVIVADDGGGGGGGGGGPNSGPSFGPQNDLSIAAGSTLTATFTASDPDAGDVLTYTLVTTDLPGTPSINPQSGVFTWTPPISAALMNFDVMIRATDSSGLNDETLFTIDVLAEGSGGGGNVAPVVQAIPDQQATVGQLLTFTVSATDDDGDILDYFLDPTGPFSANVSSAGVFTWTPTTADIGTTTFPIFVSDGDNNVSGNVTIVVSA